MQITHHPTNTLIKTKSAFTLAEASIVILIMGIMVSLALSGIEMRKRTTYNNLIVHINQMADSLVLFKDTYEYWPGDFPHILKLANIATIKSVCPLTGDAHNAIQHVNGYSGNGDGIIATARTGYDSTNHNDWGSEAENMVCHLAIVNMTASGMIGRPVHGGLNFNIFGNKIDSEETAHIPLLHYKSHENSELLYYTPAYGKHTGKPAVLIRNIDASKKDFYKFSKKVVDAYKNNEMSSYVVGIESASTHDLLNDDEYTSWTTDHDAAHATDNSFCSTAKIKYTQFIQQPGATNWCGIEANYRNLIINKNCGVPSSSGPNACEINNAPELGRWKGACFCSFTSGGNEWWFPFTVETTHATAETLKAGIIKPNAIFAVVDYK